MSFSRALLRTLARCIIYPLVEMMTMLLLLARAKIGGSQRLARPFRSAGGQCVLIIAAHPDDETIGCFGVILLHRQAGDTVKVLVATDGSGSRAGGLSPSEMAAGRRDEVTELQKLLGDIEIEQLGLVENRWDQGALEAELRVTLDKLKPHIIYAPSCVDFHPEHIKVGKALAEALVHLGSEQLPIIRAYEMQAPLGIELVNFYSPLGQYYPEKRRAIAAYKSQKGALDLWERQAKYMGALFGAAGGAEAFWEMTTPGYTSIMRHADWDWQTTPFKGLSGRPFGDFRAHVTGRRVRLSLLRIAKPTDSSQPQD